MPLFRFPRPASGARVLCPREDGVEDEQWGTGDRRETRRFSSTAIGHTRASAAISREWEDSTAASNGV